MKIFLFHSNSFLEKGDQPRLPRYKAKLEAQGHQVQYRFLTRSNQNGNWFRKGLNAVRLAIEVGSHSNRPDLLYFYSSHILFLPLYIVARVKGIRMIVEKTELDSIRPDTGTSDLLVRLAYGLDERIIGYFTDKIVVISQALADHYKNRVKHIHICPAFTDTSEVKCEPATGLKQMGYLGSFGSKDNVEGIVAAFLKANKQNPEIKLKLMGNAPEGFQSKYEDRIEFTGVIHQGEFYHHLFECDLLLSNRTDSPYAQYGSPTKLVEYLSTGIPVIATPVGAMAQELKDGEHLRFTIPDDTDLLASMMIDRYSNSAEWDAMGLRGKEFAKSNLDSSLVLEDWSVFVIS